MYETLYQTPSRNQGEFASVFATLGQFFILLETRWLGSLVVRVSDLQLNGREFDSRPPNWVVSTGMGDRLQTGIPPPYVTSHPGQLSFLPSVGREISTGQSAVIRCGWAVKAVRVGRR